MRGCLAPPRGSPNGKIPADDPRRWRSPFLTRFFTAIMAKRMGREFAAVRHSGTVSPEHVESWHGRALVLYCNHPSWWDPAFLCVLVAQLMRDRVAYAPIDSHALVRYPFMRRCGLFGIEPASRAGALTFLDIGSRLLACPNTVLCVTPQGAFVDGRSRPLKFRRGLAALLARMPDTVVVPVALEYGFWNEAKPEALARFGEPIALPDGELASVDAWQRQLTEHLTRTMDALAVDSTAREDGRFTTAIDGQVGIGGIYDAWRRAKAWSAGRRFDAHHVRPAPGSRG